MGRISEAKNVKKIDSVTFVLLNVKYTIMNKIQNLYTSHKELLLICLLWVAGWKRTHGKGKCRSFSSRY